MGPAEGPCPALWAPQSTFAPCMPGKYEEASVDLCPLSFPVYDLPSGSSSLFGETLRSGPEDATFLQFSAVDRCPSQLSSVYTEG